MDTQQLINEFKTSPLEGTSRLGVLGLRFAPEMEVRYRRYRSKANAITTQFVIVLGLVLVITMIVVDAVVMNHAYTPQARSILLWAIIPVMLVASLLCFVPRLRPHLVLVLSLHILLLTIGFITVWFVEQSASASTSAPYTYEVLIFMVLFAYLASGLRFAYSIFVGLASAAAFILTQSFAGMDTYSLYYTGSFLIAANGFGGICRYFLEYSHRREFVAREMLNYFAERDPLTGVVNRRAMELHLDKFWLQAARDAIGVGVMIIDIDNFKLINDTQGHAQGDQQLINFARMLNSIARRPWDLTARYGGDEFVIFLYDISAEDIQGHTQRLLDQVRNSGKSFTVSIGAAHCVATPTTRIEELLHLADSRLYRSKARGRDRATTAD